MKATLRPGRLQALNDGYGPRVSDDIRYNKTELILPFDILDYFCSMLRRPSKAAAALNATGVLALPFIVQRNDHQDSLGAGFAVTEFAPDGKAAQEIHGLWRWVWEKLTMESIDRGPLKRATA